jgi:hypothetical protein
MGPDLTRLAPPAELRCWLMNERARAANGEVPALRVSFARVLNVATVMWLAVGLDHGVLSEQQMNLIVRRGYARMR